MSPSLDLPTTAIIKATIPALKAHGVAITEAMYANLLRDPALAALFNDADQKSGRQPRALANAVLAYAKHIDNLGALSGTVERIAQKHVSYDIQPEHYPIVATALLDAIASTLGDAATPEILDAWGKAYWMLADILTGREASLYRDRADTPGSWKGWRSFTITERHVESTQAVSFILSPVDGQPVVRHQPGQYTTIALDIPGRGAIRRNFSLSNAPNDRDYRLTIKKRAIGSVSLWLHETDVIGTTLQMTAPAGDFVLNATSRKPIVLLSAGVGITPIISMASALAESEAPQRVTVVHVTRNAEEQIFGHALRALANYYPTVFSVTIFHTTPTADEIEGRDYDHAGRPDMNALCANLPSDADIYLCGPRSFEHSAIAALRHSGIPTDRIHTEIFSPDEGNLAA